MKVDLCSFSRYEIYYPRHGRRYVHKVFQFFNAKYESAFLFKRNPRQINWTVLYRRKHKKGQSEEIQKKKEPDVQSNSRGPSLVCLSLIIAKRNQKPEVRKQAIRVAKEAKKAKQASEKTAMAPSKAPTKAAPKQKIVKPVKVSAPPVGEKR